MFELIIYNEDKSIYWKERFNSLSDGQAWLSKEQTRPYWKKDYAFEFIDHTPPPPSQAEIDAAATKATKIANLKGAAKTILAKLDSDITAADLKALVLAFIRKKMLDGDLD